MASLEQMHDHAQDLFTKARRFTHIPVSVGIAPPRTLANRAAKKIPTYGGVCVLTPGGTECEALLREVALDDVWGVGRRLVERLTLLGMHSARDLAQAPPKQIRQRLSVTLEHTCLELKGFACIEMNDPGESRQRIMTSRSFGWLTDNREEIHQAIRQYAQRRAEKLRTQDSLARAVYVFLKTNRHRPDLPQTSPSAIVELPQPSDDSHDILHAASQAFDAIYRPHYRFMKARVMLVDLVDANRQQLSLLDTPESRADQARNDRLMATLDYLNGRMGRGTVTFGRPSPGALCQPHTPLDDPLGLATEGTLILTGTFTC